MRAALARVRYRRSMGYGWPEALRALVHEHPPPRGEGRALAAAWIMRHGFRAARRLADFVAGAPDAAMMALDAEVAGLDPDRFHELRAGGELEGRLVDDLVNDAERRLEHDEWAAGCGPTPRPYCPDH